MLHEHDDHLGGGRSTGTQIQFLSEASPMQSLDAALAPDDQKVARQIARMVLIFYSSTALMLTAWIMAHVAMRNSTTAKASVEVVAEPKSPAGAVSRR
jgi:hypothetical protein